MFDLAIAIGYLLSEKEISFAPESIKKTLGVEIKSSEIKSILESLGFAISGNNTLKVKVPFWRANDVEEAHDLIEEVARIYGYHKLPSKLMTGVIPLSEFKNELANFNRKRRAKTA